MVKRVTTEYRHCIGCALRDDCRERKSDLGTCDSWRPETPSDLVALGRRITPRQDELLRLAYELQKLATVRIDKSVGNDKDLRAASEALEEYALGRKVGPGERYLVPCPACGGYFRALLRQFY